MEVLITDIDGTILVNGKRKLQALRDITGEREYKKLSRTFLASFPSDYLSPARVHKFDRIFYSGKYLHLDEPISDAAEVLTDLNTNYKLVYLTSRHDVVNDSMLPGTLEWLETHNFPVPDDEKTYIVMKPKRKQSNVKYKSEAIPRIKEIGEIMVGIGDQLGDALAYDGSGVNPLIIYNSAFLFSKWPDTTSIVTNWEEVGDWIQDNSP